MDQVTRLRIGCFALGVAVGAQPARSQANAAIAGRVLSVASAAPLTGAELLLRPGNRRMLSDSAGRFRFSQVAPGNVRLVVRMIGFVPDSTNVTVGPNEDVDLRIELKRAAQSLDTVTVAAREQVLARGKLADFYDRMRFGVGRFFDAQLFENEQDSRLGEIIASHAPAVRLVRAHMGSATFIATGRRSAAAFYGVKPDLNAIDRDSGADPYACYADVYVDGVLVYAFGQRPPSPLFDVNAVRIATLAAVELYAGPAQIPPEYSRTGSVCGVMLLWTK